MTDRESVCMGVRGQLNRAGSSFTAFTAFSCETSGTSGDLKHAHPVFALGKVQFGGAWMDGPWSYCNVL